ncbi:TetR/AcrR family transcriptional regulator [Photobacterium aphoticum]|uniref:TetR family transcriptional regulator n=2 Tax=Photobacterium aphoticum TaxID=754436 RepID=A0A0J1GNF9_9GAMM|nr:TetR family transcriptional regulator [Photobacterium aphoticum]PSU56138.1 TetR/AcrR family transcriptional regulator [Photobacterium aphoticum]
MDKRHHIIEVATRLFSEKGFEKTPISLICEEAEVSKGLVFHHFKNKNDLLREVFVHITSVIEEVDQQDAHIDVNDIRMESLINSIFDGMTKPEHRKMYQFNFSVMVHPTTRSIVVDLIDERYQGLQTSTEEVFRALGHDNPSVITKMFIAEIDGIAMNYLLNDDFPINEIQQEFIKKYC